MEYIPLDEEGRHEVCIFSFDVVGYSKYKAYEQAEVQEIIDKILPRCLDGSNADFVGYNDEGDGGFLMLKGDNLKSALLCLEKFHQICYVESFSLDDKRFQVRYALHKGLVTIKKRPLGGYAYSGPVIVEARRMIGGFPDSKPGQILFSKSYSQLLVQHEKLNEDHFYGLSFEDKHGIEHHVVNYFDGTIGFDWKSELKKIDVIREKQEKRESRKRGLAKIIENINHYSGELTKAVLIIVFWGVVIYLWSLS